MTYYEGAFQSMAELTAPEASDFKCIMNALSIMNESNKYINTCLMQSTNTAKVKLVEQRLVFDKKHPEIEKTYQELIKKAQHFVDFKIEVFLKRGVKKKASGQLTLFDNMFLIATLNKKNFLKVLKIYKLNAVKFELIDNQIIVFTATNELEDSSQIAQEIAGSSTKIRFETPKIANDSFDKLNKLKIDINKNRVYGVDIKILLEREQNDSGVPFVVQSLCEYMETGSCSSSPPPLLFLFNYYYYFYYYYYYYYYYKLISIINLNVDFFNY